MSDEPADTNIPPGHFDEFVRALTALAPRSDGYANPTTGLGIVGQDKTLGGSVGGPGFDLYAYGFQEAEARYRGSDLGRAVVEKIPEEMTRKGWRLDVQPDDEDAEIATDADAHRDASCREPARAAAAWRLIARRLDGRARLRARAMAERWDAFGGMPAEPVAAPTPPPAPLPKITREGLDVAEAVEKTAKKLGATAAILQALKYERAYGGGVVFIGVDQGSAPHGVAFTRADGVHIDASDSCNLTAPLDWSRVKRITHLTALRGGADGVVVSWRPYRFPIWPKYGQPEIYQVTNSTVTIAKIPAPGEAAVVSDMPNSPSGPTIFYVHESRFLVFNGEPTSIEAQQASNGWGDSIFTRVGTPLYQFEQNWQSACALMAESSVASVGIEGFTAALASKGVAARDAFIQYARLVGLMRSVTRTNFHDSKEVRSRENASFAGVAELFDRGLQRVAAAAETPVSILFGNLAGGLGATEDPSTRGWHAKIESRQESRLREPLEYLYTGIMRSTQGPTRGEEPSKWALTFNPLWSMTEQEQAALELSVTQADAIRIDKGILLPEEIAAKRYGGAVFDPGCPVIDMDARRGTQSMVGGEATNGAPTSATKVPIELTATAQGAIVKVNEARASIGLGPLLLANGQVDPQGEMTIAEFSVRNSAVIAGAAQTEEGTPVSAQGATEPPPAPALPPMARRPAAAKPAPTETAPKPDEPAPDPNKGTLPPANQGDPSSIIVPPIRMMATDPITGAPTGSPTVLGETGKRDSADPDLDEAIRILLGADADDSDEEVELLAAGWRSDAAGHGDAARVQPRDKDGRFAAVEGARATVASHVAKHLASQGIGATAQGSSVQLHHGGSIDIGKKGERIYNGAGAHVQHVAESHLTTHPAKHIAAWARKTTPTPAVVHALPAHVEAPTPSPERATKSYEERAKIASTIRAAVEKGSRKTRAKVWRSAGSEENDLTGESGPRGEHTRVYVSHIANSGRLSEQGHIKILPSGKAHLGGLTGKHEEVRAALKKHGIEEAA